MNHPFSELQAEYEHDVAVMKIVRQADVDATVHRILPKKNLVMGVVAKTGIPAAFILASFEREASCNFDLSPAQGDRWDHKSVHVPKDRGPFPSWEASAEDAYHLDHLDAVGADNWTWARCCYELELFNGFGYRSRGLRSPYLWGGTNLQQLGKFTSDGYFDAKHMDTQLGAIAIMRGLIDADATLALGHALPVVESPSIQPPMPVPVGLGENKTTTQALQDSLNRILHLNPPLYLDGSYGRMTRNAVMEFQRSHGLEPDGLAGPLTKAALVAALKPE